MASSAAASELIALVADHFFTDDFQGSIDAFIQDNCRAFKGVTDAHIEGEENKIEYWTIYQKFVELFESKMKAFLEEKGSSTEEFYKACKEVSSDDKGKWGESATFINLVVATSEYKSFLVLMKEEAADLSDDEEGSESKK